MNKSKHKASDSLVYPFAFVALLWVIKFYEVFTHTDLSVYGILPRTSRGLIGIVVSPLIHGNFSHLISNSLPLLILGIIVFNFYRKIAFDVFFWIYFISGICVWIIGEEAYHIGASGIVYGFISFLIFSGIFRGELKSLLLAILVLVVYGGVIWGILPGQAGISWQSHLFGAIAGAMVAYVYRNVR